MEKTPKAIEIKEADEIDAVIYADVAKRVDLSHAGKRALLSGLLTKRITHTNFERHLDRIHYLVRCAETLGYFCNEVPGEGVLLATLLIKNRLAPTDWTAEIIEKELDVMARAYIDAIQEAVPTFDKKAANWRYNFMVGCVLISLVQKDAASRIQRLSDGLCSLDEREKMREEIVDFIVYGMHGCGQAET